LFNKLVLSVKHSHPAQPAATLPVFHTAFPLKAPLKALTVGLGQVLEGWLMVVGGHHGHQRASLLRKWDVRFVGG